MSSLFEITFTQPESGWIGLRLSGPDAVFEDSFPHIYPTLEQLCGGLCDVAAGVSARRVTFLLEPAELELGISFIDGGDAQLTVDLYSDRRRYPTGSARRYLMPPRFLMRPLLNSGTLGGR